MDTLVSWGIDPIKAAIILLCVTSAALVAITMLAIFISLLITKCPQKWHTSIICGLQVSCIYFLAAQYFSQYFPMLFNSLLFSIPFSLLILTVSIAGFTNRNWKKAFTAGILAVIAIAIIKPIVINVYQTHITEWAKMQDNKNKNI